MKARYERQARRASQAQKRRERHLSALPTGVWLVLEAPPWRPEEPDETFDAFFEAKEAYADPDCPRDGFTEIREYDREGRALLVDALPPLVEPDGEGEEEPPPPSLSHPWGPLLWLRPNTHTLQCQLRVLQNLDNRPAPRLASLTRLVSTRPSWESVRPVDIGEEEWIFLRAPVPGAPLRDGTQEQRQFVRVARGTPDFALLEGPPGSGKTTAICELIVQLARQGQRVLLVASTHVAVDNVLERLLEWQDTLTEKPLLPVRIGEEDRIRAESVIPWTYQRLLRTWRDELLDFLDTPGAGVEPEGSAARHMLQEALNHPRPGEAPPITRLLLESANLVCGTTIGILKHPAIQQASRQGEPFEPFDVMILDEASKTTFTEFLVPALHARKWIIVGDVHQLSPYVEESNLAENVRGLLPEPEARAAAHAFLASRRGRARQPGLIAVHSAKEAELLAIEAEARDVAHVDLDSAPRTALRHCPGAIPGLLYAELVFGSPETLRAFEHRLPGDLGATGGALPALPDWEAHRLALKTEVAERPVDWASEVAWRLVRSHELRQSADRRQRYLGELEELQPASLDDKAGERLERDLRNIRRVALPSILELLQKGFERLAGWRNDVALTAGLPREHLAQRLVSLRFQYRMHPHISAFSREHFYSQGAEPQPPLDDFENSYAEMFRIDEPRDQLGPRVLLQDATSLEAERAWSYRRYARRALWLDVAPAPGRRNALARRKPNENPSEVQKVLGELAAFVEWARGNPRRDKQGRPRPWEVAILTFYRGQESALRDALRKLPGQGGNTHNFHLPQAEEAVQVSLATVDRFQGQEADLVLLSFVKSGSVGFLDSPNRLNVALTRARYQLVLIGHRTWFASERCPVELLRSLATSPHYVTDIGWEEQE
ncbi:AAA domain-containing protein [Archangium sp.]|uniref:AAA domain-containing protein n=1 Tax=Archangium sp. TaxID=1872627 RepID=UPI002EDAC96B